MDTVVDAALLNALLVVPLAVFAAAVSHLLRRPAVAHALWLLVLLKLLTPPLLRLPIPWVEDEAAPAVAALPPEVSADPAPPEEPPGGDAAEPAEEVTVSDAAPPPAWPAWRTVVG